MTKPLEREVFDALRELEREKGISFDTILAGLEEALASAIKSTMHLSEEDAETTSVRMTIDRDTGEYRAYVGRVDEEGTVTGEHEVPVPDDFMARIAAQTAKQVIFQKLRDAEREMTYEEFAGREGDLVTGIVQTMTKDGRRPSATLLDLGKVEAILPHAEQVPSEAYRHGERLQAYVVEVRRKEKGPQIIVSRTHPNLLRKLFELEVPEIAEGIVEIKAVAREPGHRSKVAVTSHEPGVDAVGACVGAKGSRVRMVVNQLKGEKIDVIEWDEDPARFVQNALSPASVKQVKIDPETETALVIVPDYQLSLAIGKEGQNARLAARLTGWRIDIKSETEAADEASGARPAPPAPEARPAEPETAPDAAGPAAGEATSPAGPGTAAPVSDLRAGAEETGRCKAVLASGERCANAARPGSDYCGIPAHQKQGQTEIAGA